jgi:hypothetical protein
LRPVLPPTQKMHSVAVCGAKFASGAPHFGVTFKNAEYG